MRCVWWGGLLCLLLQGLLACFGGYGVNACPEKAAQVRGWHARVLAYYLFLVSSLHAMWGKILIVCCPNPSGFESEKTRQALHTCMRAKCSMFLEHSTILRALYVVFYAAGFLLEGKADLMSDSCLGWIPKVL